MSDFIQVERNVSTATHAPLLLLAVQQGRQFKQTLDAIISIGFHNFDAGPPADFTAFEALFGVPGNGQAVFNFVNGAKNSFEGTQQTDDAKVFIEIVG